MASPSVYLVDPNPFVFIPDTVPEALAPPQSEGNLRVPFTINATLYRLALRPELPLAFATAYIFIVLRLNAFNRRRKNKPWSISRTSYFRFFVVLHNVLLALYSLITFIAMNRALSRIWPGLIMPGNNAAATYADALCQLHGPRGLGSAATFNTTINIWESPNPAIRMGRDGQPDSTDVGRLWNEGLAFWGWLFYMSKFYEVVDTLVILAKGKRSPTLQTYHHAGAMLCMWSGIRYMSAPIWMFVFLNSGIHAMMYTYFTLSALGYKVPQRLKRTLTTMQIAQFIFGSTFAAMHLFVEYDMPIAVPYDFVSSVEHAVANAGSAVSSIVEVPTAITDWTSLAKKLLLRAAGEEGPAERIGQVSAAVSSAVPKAAKIAPKVEKVVTKVLETRWHPQTETVRCINTTGEVFAIYLNLVYLTPLTGLFVRFFIKAYSTRGKTPAQAAKQAQKETKNAVEKKGIKAEDEVESISQIRAADLQEQVRRDLQALRQGEFITGSSATARRLSQHVSEAIEHVRGELVEMVDSFAKSQDSPTSSPNNSPKRRTTPPLEKDSLETPQESAPIRNVSGGSLFRSTILDEDRSDASSIARTGSVESHGAVSNATRMTEYSTYEADEEDIVIAQQEKTLSSSEPMRPGPDDPTDDDPTPPSASLSEAVQDANLAASQPVRPEPEADSDAMGRSGIDVSSD